MAFVRKLLLDCTRPRESQSPAPARSSSWINTAGILTKAASNPLPANVADLALKHWDKGVFEYELLQQGLVVPSKSDPTDSQQLSEGTYAGTQLALTEAFDRIENRYGTQRLWSNAVFHLLTIFSFGIWLNVLGIESTIPRPLTLDQKREIYKYQPSSKDRYPPHLDVIPTADQVSRFEIFDKLGLLQSAILIPNIVPKTFVSQIASGITEKFREWIFGNPEKGITIREIEQLNKVNRKSGTDIMRGANIGDLPDWYTDARFAQQYLTGTNPATIQLVSPELLDEFRQAAQDQDRKDIVHILNDKASFLYMTDCRYFRTALGLNSDDPIVLSPADEREPTRYGCASVTLFQLHENGNLHPLGIVIDYKSSMRNSVVTFNERVSPTDSAAGESWHWRYAKTCAQSSDWTLHELTVHLVNTHFIEEAIIVATHRCIPVNNIIYQLLEPHWYRTLSLNAAARETLVPSVVLALVGYSEDQGYNFLQHAYHDFKFQAKYVPRDLKDRGFPIKDLGSGRFRNCSYARNINLMWSTIHKFVSSMVALQYKSDSQVAGDKQIQAWCEEIQSPDGAQISSFPTITTLDELIDAITMCIHIASPQHTAVNYLQSFYQTFVINKPPCLFQPLPTTLADLKGIKESFLVKSLPIGHQRHWLLASHIPWLLSFRPAEDNNLINYAASLWNLYKKKGASENGPQIAQFAKTFYEDLRSLVDVFEKQTQEMGKKEKQIPYRVLDPRDAAVSILI